MTVSEGQSATARNVADIRGIVVQLDVDSDRLLFIMVGADGSINRIGSGAFKNKNRDMFIGVTDPGIFKAVRSHLTEDMLECQGETLQHQTPRRGATCKLDVRFFFKDGTSAGGFAFLYGSESEGPPSHVVDLVRAAVHETESWYQEQLKMVEKSGP